LPVYVTKPVNRLNEYWMDAAPFRAASKNAGHFSRRYLGQSVWDMTGSVTERRWNTAIFLKEYAEAAGLTPDDLSPKSREYMFLLYNGQDPGLKLTFRNGRGVGREKVADYGAAFISVMQEITDLKAKILGRKAIQASVPLEYGAVVPPQVNWSTPDSEVQYRRAAVLGRLERIQLHDGVLLLDRQTGEPLGAAYALDPRCENLLDGA
jgi:hypothetical protein